MENEKELEDEMEELEKELEENKEGVQEKIDDQIQQMSYLWDRVHTKLRNDNVCFHSKKPLVNKGDKKENVRMHVLEATTAESGSVTFVSVSHESFLELQEKQQNESKKEKKE
jgi:hypothetical protein